MNSSSIPSFDDEGNPKSTGSGNGASLNGSGHPHADDGIRIEEIDVVDDTAPNLSEQAIATEFAERYVDRLRYVKKWGKWFVWNGKYWAEDDTQVVFDLVVAVCREYSRLAKKRALTMSGNGFARSVLSLASANRQLVATTDQWDNNPWLLNTPSCVVNLRTGKKGEARPEYFMRMITSVGPMTTRADGDNCPRWMAFLNQIFNNDKELINYLQKVCGYCLTGSIREQQMWFGWGSGRNGKGVFVEVFSRLMGDYAATAEIETFTVNKNEHHSTELARLAGKRLVTSAETEEGRRWAEARIKQITGGDKITARYLYQDLFEYLPQFKLFLTGNHMPVLRNVGLAMARRFNRVPFTVTIPPEQENVNLAAELIEREGPGILLWMIEGCVAWQRDGLAKPLAVRASTKSYLDAQDLLGQWIEDCCEKGEWVGTGELYSSWKMWCEARGESFGSQRNFSMKLEDRGIEKGRNKPPTLHGFVGWKLKTPNVGGDAVGDKAADLQARAAF